MDPFEAGAAAPTYPSRSHFQSTQNRKGCGQGEDKRCRSSREEKWEDGQERENSRLISKRLGAALPRSFRGQHGKKWLVCGECRG